MSKTAICLWFDTQADEAAEFYSEVFENWKIENTTHYLEGDRMPVGTPLLIRCSLQGLEIDLLNGGPEFRINPSISFYVSCETEHEVDILWNKLSDGGMALMELGEYPFSKRFGWMQDKYGVSWQISLDKKVQKVTPFFMFTREFCGKAKQAAEYYCKLFQDAGMDSIVRFGENEVEPAGYVKTLEFHIGDQHFMAMDSSAAHPFRFNEAASVIVYCRDQDDIDKTWDALTADGGEESMCGWLRDPYGIWWQVVNDDFEKMMDGDSERVSRVMNEMYKMKKLDVQILRDAYDGKLAGVKEETVLDAGPFYHGTKADMKIGDLLEPGYRSNYGVGNKANYIYMAATLEAAIWGAELAKGDGPGRIYRVEPTGSFENDPNLTDKKFPGNPTRSYRTKEALCVVGEVLEWEPHAPEVLQKMRDSLEELKRQGIEAINE